MKRGSAFTRATRVTFKADKGGMYSGKDADGTEVLVYFNDTANVISCTEVEPDPGPDEGSRSPLGRVDNYGFRSTIRTDARWTNAR